MEGLAESVGGAAAADIFKGLTTMFERVAG
jgi:hypothetical protein